MAVAAGAAVANLYNSIVDAPAWGHDIPASIATAKQYYAATNPGTFYRIFSPINQLLALLSVLLFWKRGGTMRVALLTALLLYFAAEGMTFLYFYPRNDIMFGAVGADVETLQATWKQWSTMNWVRTLLIVAGVVCSAIGLHSSYEKPVTIAVREPRRAGAAETAMA